MPLSLDHEVASVLSARTGRKPRLPPAPIGDVAARRVFFNIMSGIFQEFIPFHNDDTKTDFYTISKDGHDLLLRWYTKARVTLKDSPVVLYMHGGGMIVLSVSQCDKMLANYVHHTSVPFLSVEYRLAPEFPAPIPVEDCYTALQWLHSNASNFGVKGSRIAVMCDSHGGGLAACLPLFVRAKKGSEKIAKQTLIYPMLDDGNVVPDDNLVPFATWNYNENATAWQAVAWQAVLGSKLGKDVVSRTKRQRP